MDKQRNHHERTDFIRLPLPRVPRAVLAAADREILPDPLPHDPPWIWARWGAVDAGHLDQLYSRLRNASDADDAAEVWDLIAARIGRLELVLSGGLQDPWRSRTDFKSKQPLTGPGLTAEAAYSVQIAGNLLKAAKKLRGSDPSQAVTFLKQARYALHQIASNLPPGLIVPTPGIPGPALSKEWQVTLRMTVALDS